VVSGGSHVEEVKAASRHLRGTLSSDLADGGTSFVADNQVLLKFHGIYQQDDRDVRRARASKKLPLDYSCMVRAAVPGGVLSASQWLALDRVAGFAGDALRLTTRQGVQFHTVQKQSLKPLIGALNESLLTTLAACGDVVRNTMACPAPLPDGRQEILNAALHDLVRRFRPRTRAYWELWVDGESAASALALPPSEDEVEPIYGDVYLPRKFKIGFAWPGDNCIDVYSQDIGLVPTLSDGTTGTHTGWAVFIGGGMGMSHARENDTYPRLATPFAWIPPSLLAPVAEAIITTQRDFGNREDRNRARLKYLVDERGTEWFRNEVSSRIGMPLPEPVPLPEWGTADDHHGWLEQADGRWALGVPVESGRVRDGADGKYRTAFRSVVESGLVSEIRITPRQDVLLCGVDASARRSVEEVLVGQGVALAHEYTPLRRLAVACPALPTCGQALAEAERVLPHVVEGIDKALAAGGADGAAVRLNMTGCPNGCARPYTAEIGIVGRTKSTYDVYVGGSTSGDRMATRLRADVALDDVPALLQPLFEQWSSSGRTESFGDWSDHMGTEALAVYLPAPTVRRRGRQAAGESDA
jgi:sulfite reductase (ferredoxin)